MQEEKEELIAKLQEHHGCVPISTRYLLDVLTRPDLIEYTKRYIRAMDKESECQNYQAPWNCARQAEAYYENIKYGWLGAGANANGIGLAEWWCENCRRKVMEF